MIYFSTGSLILTIYSGSAGLGKTQMTFDELLTEYAPQTPVEDCPALVAHQTADIFAFWKAWEASTGTPQEVPFWAAVWPAARLTAAFLMSHSRIVEGKRVLEIGSGSGVVSIAAMKTGASLSVANDIDPVAELVALKNAQANAVSLSTDTTNLVSAGIAPIFDIVFVADMFYQKEYSRRLLTLLTKFREQGSDVYIADGHRPFAPTSGVETLEERTLSVSYDLEGVRERNVRLLRLR